MVDHQSLVDQHRLLVLVSWLDGRQLYSVASLLSVDNHHSLLLAQCPLLTPAQFSVVAQRSLDLLNWLRLAPVSLRSLVSSHLGIFSSSLPPVHNGSISHYNLTFI